MGWERRATCKCGRTFEAWRGREFFVAVDCCPDCGTVRGDFIVRTVRWVPPVRAGWRQGWKIITPGFWQRKDQTE